MAGRGAPTIGDGPSSEFVGVPFGASLGGD
jgi:hypothetical protein